MITQKLPSANSAMLTISNTALTLQQAIRAADSPTSDGFEFRPSMNYVELQVETNSMRFCLDGNTPTANDGTLVGAGKTITIEGTLDAIKMIRATGSDASVTVVRIGCVKEGESPQVGGGSAISGGDASAANQVLANGYLDGLEALLTTIDVDTGDIAVDADAIRVAVQLIDNMIYAEDVAHQANDPGAFVLAVRRDVAASPVGTDGDYGSFGLDALGHVWTREGYAPGYEDNVVNVAKTEQRYSTSGLLVADTQVKASAGFVHAVTISPADILPTAGTLDIYDNTSAAGTKIFSMYIPASVFLPFTILLNTSCANGIYVDFTTTADVNVFVSYR